MEIRPFGTGHINDTYACRFRHGGAVTRWVLQRINHRVFARPREVMDNVDRVTRHLRAKVAAAGGNIDREVLTFVPTVEGEPLLEREDGTFWRVSKMIEGTRTYDEPDSPERVCRAAWAFGRFQQHVADLDGRRLHETITGFHDTGARFEALMHGVDADPWNRAKGAQAEIAFATARADETARLEDLRAAGVLPERVTHNDTKLNNVLFDETSGEALCVIDLDTVMPGLALYDFGDMVRGGARIGAEDALEIDTVHMDIALFEQMTKGYLDAIGDTLTGSEKDELVFSAWIITVEQGIRFLTDHLGGDRYYKTYREEHNLQRCRAQFALAADMERRRADMERIVARYR